MKLRSIISAFIILVSLQAVNAQNIDTGNSIVTFEVSNMAFKTVEGSFKGMKGAVKFDENNLSESSFQVCIDAATVNTENEDRDKHLKNEDFFEVETYPEICFTSTSIVKSTSGYTAKGMLKMHGVEKEVEIPFSVKDNTFEGTLVIDRYDYKVGGSGKFMVGREINLKIKSVVKSDSI
ncbi:YceI family protein [Sediminitomix flava]|uniref:Polyisoprenoid-binding protein YceI n=1 Tax=Sediminitomix flava TaxID=379075 RepID=A0A315ZHE1_SEDFL|nr:YceI family protein [Sediminitomix flava]PWJ44613.1 polyisoprenoid-binding protein YceI [Sediminitomix flava]